MAQRALNPIAPAILLVAFMNSTVLMGVVAFLMAPESTGAPVPHLDLALASVGLLQAIAGVALGYKSTPAVGWYWQQSNLLPVAGNNVARDSGSSYLGRFQTRVIVALALAEGSAVFGLVIAVLGWSKTVGLAMLGLSFVGVVLVAPAVLLGVKTAKALLALEASARG
ncbi:MAG: hypothetical protein SF028_01155 [Candidatus Sumerlaeia bacterium]|nr:hypothetical protein [Candidatus Sumerlaeia bacterium]